MCQTKSEISVPMNILSGYTLMDVRGEEESDSRELVFISGPD